MHIQAIQFFCHINFLCQQNNFLFYTGRFQFDFGFCQAIQQALTLPVENSGHVFPYFCCFNRNTFQPLLKQGFQFVTFGTACRDKLFEYFIKCRQQGDIQRIHILFFTFHHAGPAQDVHRIKLSLSGTINHP